MENTVKTDEKDYQAEALFLVTRHGQTMEERDWLEKRLAGSWVYTVDDAIRDLDNLTVSYEGERVQSSNISNPTERIALKITSTDYMQRKQRKLDAEKQWAEGHLAYCNWKVSLMETVLRERLDKRTRGIFKKCMVEGWTYRHMQRSYKGRLSNSQITDAKQKMILAAADQLKVVAGFEPDNAYLKMLIQETAEAFKEETEETNGKTKETAAGGGCGQPETAEGDREGVSEPQRPGQGI